MGRHERRYVERDYTESRNGGRLSVLDWEELNRWEYGKSDDEIYTAQKIAASLMAFNY